MPKSYYKPYRSEPVDRERLMELLDYDAETGETWRKTFGRAKAGYLSQRQWYIRYDGRCYSASLLAWVYCYGEMAMYRQGWRDENRLKEEIRYQ